MVPFYMTVTKQFTATCAKLDIEFQRNRCLFLTIDRITYIEQPAATNLPLIIMPFFYISISQCPAILFLIGLPYTIMYIFELASTLF